MTGKGRGRSLETAKKESIGGLLLHDKHMKIGQRGLWKNGNQI